MASKRCESTYAGTKGAAEVDAGAVEVDGISVGLALLAPQKATARSPGFQQFFLM